MNMSEDKLSDYDDNYICDEDQGPELQNGSTVMLVFYYMVFCLSVIGMFKKT